MPYPSAQSVRRAVCILAPEADIPAQFAAADGLSGPFSTLEELRVGTFQATVCTPVSCTRRSRLTARVGFRMSPSASVKKFAIPGVA